ncbi:MAG: ATP-binding protein [Lachnospiraceae bacterium]
MAYFKIISSCTQTIKITSAQKGLKRLGPIRFELHPGENVLSVPFIIEDNYFKKRKKTYDDITMPNLCFFKVNNKIDVMESHYITICQNEHCLLCVESQEDFRSDFFSVKTMQEAIFWFISGVSGMGKTTIIERCIEESNHKFGNNYYLKFNLNKQNNLTGIIYAILFLLFPYIYPEEITVEYLDSIHIDISLKTVLQQLIAQNSNIDNLKNCISNIIENEITIIPRNLDINPRMLFFDDLHLIDELSLNFLMYTFDQIRRLPVFCILCGQPTFFEITAYKTAIKKTTFKIYSFELSSKDIITNLNNLFDFSFDIGDSLIDFFFPNMIVFNLYIKYIKDCGSAITDIDSFILNYIYFKNNYTSSEYINSQFNVIFSKFPSAANLCREIYTSSSGVAVAQDKSNDIAILLNHQLVKYDEHNMLVPLHDIYLKHFRQIYRINTSPDNILEYLQYTLERTDILSVNDDIYLQVKDLRCKEKFYSVNYILEGIFESAEKKKYRRLWGDELYYLLYFEYAYAAINCNRHTIGYDCLEKICNGLQGTSSEKLITLNIEVIFELINSYYHNGEYEKCREYFQTFENCIDVLIKRGTIGSDKMNQLFYVLSTNYMILIDSEKNRDGVLEDAEKRKKFLKEHYYHHYIDFLLQFAHTMYIRDWTLACKWITEAYESIRVVPTSYMKQTLKVNFSYYLIQYLNSKETNFPLNKIKAEMDQMKSEYYSSYRHKNFIYCAILYIIDSVEEADSLLFKDISNSRKLRKKMRGYYYQLLALHYLKHNSFEMAKGALIKSKLYCYSLDSYVSIIDHNIALLENNNVKLEYAICTSPVFDCNTFYVDPRME